MAYGVESVRLASLGSSNEFLRAQGLHWSHVISPRLKLSMLSGLHRQVHQCSSQPHSEPQGAIQVRLTARLSISDWKIFQNFIMATKLPSLPLP